MDKRVIGLLVRGDSPAREMVLKAVGARGEWEARDLSEPAELGGCSVVVWDPWGWGLAEAEEWGRRIEELEVGVVLVAWGEGEAEDFVEGLSTTWQVADARGSVEGLVVALELALTLAGELVPIREKVRKLEAERAKKQRISRAKYLLMQAYRLTEPEALRRLQQRSRRTNKPLEVVAEEVIAELGPKRR